MGSMSAAEDAHAQFGGDVDSPFLGDTNSADTMPHHGGGLDTPLGPPVTHSPRSLLLGLEFPIVGFCPDRAWVDVRFCFLILVVVLSVQQSAFDPDRGWVFARSWALG